MAARRAKFLPIEGVVFSRGGVNCRPVGAYSLGEVARICKVSRARLRYWERTALLETSDQADSQPAFAFRDLVSVRTVVGMIERGVPLRRIRRSVESLRRRFPDLDRPLDALRVWMDGSDRVVVRHQGVLLEPNGQTVIDFSPTPPAGGGVAPLAPRERTESAAGRALEWFERGCHNDSDPATYATAVEAYRRAIEAAPDFADAHCNLGSVYFNLERRAAARACFERAVALEARHMTECD